VAFTVECWNIVQSFQKNIHFKQIIFVVVVVVVAAAAASIYVSLSNRMEAEECICNATYLQKLI
jgi:hypothetical protein